MEERIDAAIKRLVDTIDITSDADKTLILAEAISKLANTKHTLYSLEKDKECKKEKTWTKK